ncbi:MAG: hypothetical protein IJM28_04555 [Lachnospiraceae bacterium]|nr:hypothetical protein [Lachnospiraceae bacterium]
MKNLETEYKDQISAEVPDLWGRIEAGIDEIEAKKGASKEAPTTEANATTITGASIEKKDNITYFNKNKGTIAKILAAVACLLIAVIAIRGGVLRNFGNMSKSAQSEVAMEATESTTTENSYMEETTEAPIENNADELSPDEKNAIITALSLIGFENVSEIKKETMLDTDITKANEILPEGKAHYMISFKNEETNEECIGLYTYSEGVATFYIIEPKEPSDYMLYLK